MANTIKTIPIEDILAQTKKWHETKDAKDRCLVITGKTDNQPHSSGTRFLNARITTAKVTSAEPLITFRDMFIPRGIADPANVKDPRNKYKGTRSNIEVTMSTAGIVGETFALLDDEFKAEMNAYTTANPKHMIDKKHHPFVNRVCGSQSKTPGEDIKDPTIHFKMAFDRFPATHYNPALRNQVKTTIRDFKKPINKNGKIIEFAPATVKVKGPDGVEREVPVNEENMHLFITDGSVAKFMRVYASSVAISSLYASLPLLINNIVIEGGGECKFEEDYGEAQEDQLAAALTVTTLSTENPPPNDDKVAEEHVDSKPAVIAPLTGDQEANAQAIAELGDLVDGL